MCRGHSKITKRNLERAITQLFKRYKFEKLHNLHMAMGNLKSNGFVYNGLAIIPNLRNPKSADFFTFF